MGENLVTEIPSVINSIQNHWQFMSLCAVLFTIVLYVYWKYLKKESDLLIHKVQELEAAKTLIRKQDRDKQFTTYENFYTSELTSTNKRLDTVDAKVDGLGRSYDRHCEESIKKFDKLDIIFERIDTRLKSVEEKAIKEPEFKELQKSVQKIETWAAGIDASMKYLVEEFRLSRQANYQSGNKDAD